MTNDKLGPYIQKLMTTVLDNKEDDDFVKELALTELTRLKVNIDEFVAKHYQVDDTEEVERTEKVLLQEQSD